MIIGLIVGFLSLGGIGYRILKWSITLDASVKSAHKCVRRIEKKVNKLTGLEGEDENENE